MYALIDPRHKEVRYIGVSSEPWGRVFAPFEEGRPWQSHVAEARHGDKSHKAYWIRGLLNAGLMPQMVVIDWGEWTVYELAEREVHWIAFYRSIGAALLNRSGGGEQTPLWKMSDETRELISRRTREAMQDPEVRAKARLGGLGKTPWNKGRVTRVDKPLLTADERTASYAARGEKIQQTKQANPRTPEQWADLGVKMALGKRLAKARRKGWVLTVIA